MVVFFKLPSNCSMHILASVCIESQWFPFCCLPCAVSFTRPLHPSLSQGFTQRSAFGSGKYDVGFLSKNTSSLSDVLCFCPFIEYYSISLRKCMNANLYRFKNVMKSQPYGKLFLFNSCYCMWNIFFGSLEFLGPFQPRTVLGWPVWGSEFST